MDSRSMEPLEKPLEPFGLGLLAFLEGDASAELIVRRDDGYQTLLPIRYFFRGPQEFTAIERTAIACSKGRVLDVGAGSGLHSLVLQEKGLRVTAIDTSAGAVEVMTRRGVEDVRRADVFDYQGGPFDSILMLGHGIGMVETLEGLDRFLRTARPLLLPDGQILCDSLDVRATRDPQHLAYHEASRQAGRYIGEIPVQCEYLGQRGAWCSWLHVDAETLDERAAKAGYSCEVLVREADGNYLARLASID